MLLYRRIVVLLLALLLGSGCAHTGSAVSLQEVRDFADASAKLGGYAELSTRFRDTYQREQPYLSPASDKLARDNDAKRRAAYDDFIAAQKAVVTYMQVLSMLAGEARFDLSPQIDDLGSGLRALPDTGLEPRHVTAFTGLTRLLTRVAASNYQGRSVESMVRDGDPDVQALLDAMVRLTKLYAKTADNEKKTVLGLFDVEVPFAARPQDRVVATLAKVHYLAKAQEFKLIDRRFDLALQGLGKVAQGHQKLRENLDRMSNDEVRKQMVKYTADLRLIREGLSNP